ncbi:MFS transporter, DHA1 family, bicyclomycin/chloramphenicol resistance protein/MFS transporter, DHA1 family, florfenicol/chloramphenicol resistance protein [Kushneria avicenniae]|uniref:Bcr/CflA family efflux transporter n=1 Tax=Kushneria avicenniae TaxID=402385 RepID=A0A1I1GIL8_9GAMM|nr:multidrug effflux MFS transporter [Kushneria avicenniae]SFC09193.1 MFS transporter, DHA1 family, bicyclomycin/chloramphenicol resistance protein/MFS transporter, DHA1 family, florfenicol/chloramphenicol resistance protein [Kushneria avicenniae]
MGHLSGSRRLIAMMMALIVLTPMGVDIFLPSLPMLAQDFALETAGIKWSITLYLISMGAGQLLAGPLVDALGRRPMALAGASLYAMAGALCLFAEHIGLFYAGRLLQGLGASMATVVAFSCVRDRFEGERRAGIYSFLNAAVCVVPALAPLLGSVLAAYWHWRASFVFMVVFALGVTLFCLWGLEETRPLNRRQQRWSDYGRDVVSILRDGHFIFHALIAMTGMTVILIYVTTAPILLIDRAGLSELAFGAWFGTVAAINVIAYFLAPGIMARMGQHNAIRTGLAIMVAGGCAHGVLYTLVGSGVATFMLPNAVMVTGFSLTLGAALSLALEPYADRAGLASSLAGCCQMGGGALMASLLTSLPVSPQWILALTGLLGAGGLLLLTFQGLYRCRVPG